MYKYAKINPATSTATFFINTRIGIDAMGKGIDGAEMSNEILQAKEDGYAIQVRISSGGGNVQEALTLVQAIEQTEADTFVDGIAASSASIVAIAGKNSHINKSSQLMIHNPFNPANPEEETPTIKAIRNQIINLYQAKTGLNPNSLAELMRKNTWINSDNAKKLGFIDHVFNHGKIAELSVDNSVEELEAICNEYLSKNNEELMENENQTVENQVEAPQVEAVETAIENTIETETATVETEEVETAVETPVVLTVEDFTEYQDALQSIENFTAQIENYKSEIENYKSEIETISNELKTFKQSQLDKEIETVVNEAIKGGKIKADSKSEWVEICNMLGIEKTQKTISNLPLHQPVAILDKLNIDNSVDQVESLVDLARTNPNEYKDLYVNRPEEFRQRYLKEYGVMPE